MTPNTDEGPDQSLWYLYQFIHCNHDHGIERRMVGKFLIAQGQIHVLEDHEGFLAGLDNLDTDKAAKKLQSLNDGQYTELVNSEDIAMGKRPDLLESLPKPAEPDQTTGGAMAMPADYEYHRVGLQTPQKLSFKPDSTATLDNYQLSDLELGRMIDNLHTQRASIRRMGETEKTNELQKQEEYFGSLAKADPELAGALNHVRTAVKAGTMPQSALRVLAGHIFKDTMVPSMGNKYAYNDFLNRPRKGVHVHLDLNDFGTINKLHGHPVGDAAIKAAGEGIRSAMDRSVGKANGKLFRTGGDEFIAHVPTHEHAARFVRELKNQFAKIAPIGGTHNISASIGVGENPQTAEHGLVAAKTAKKSAAYELGQAKNHAYSAIPGFEGHLPTE